MVIAKPTISKDVALTNISVMPVLLPNVLKRELKESPRLTPPKERRIKNKAKLINVAKTGTKIFINVDGGLNLFSTFSPRTPNPSPFLRSCDGKKRYSHRVV